MTTFVRAANPIWWLPDLTGVSLNDNYWAFFLTNVFPYVPQAVYQDPAGATAWSDPIQFSPAGTLPNNLYFDPTLVYRIEVRRGNTQADPLIWEIDNFVPGESGTEPAVEDSLTVAANLITNPQFADLFFEEPITYTQASPGTYSIAVGPGWLLIMTGSGTVTLTQDTNAGSSGIAGNPPYFLDILTSGWTTVTLQQTLANNGAIFSGGAIAVALTAASVTSANVVTVQYAPSTGSATNIFQQSIPVGALIAYTGYANTGDALHPLPLSTNTDVGTAAFVNINILLPATGEVQITNVQIVGQSTSFSTGFNVTTDLPAFREVTYEQVENGEFNVYKNPLIYKQVPSYLIGWDFPLNPAQFVGASVPAQALGANTSFYAWDQTIVFQSATSGASISRDSSGAFTINAAKSVQIAIIQYLDQVQVRKLLNQFLSLNISALTTKSGGLPITVSLWYTTGSALPTITSGTNQSIVATLDANGKPATFNNPTGGTWSELQTINLQTLTATVGPQTPNSGFGFNDYGFTEYFLNSFSVANAVTYFAVVIGTAAMANLDTLHINSVSLCAGKLACRPAPQTEDEVLRECQYYYEKSYPSNVAAGTATSYVGMCSAPAFIINQSLGGGHTNYLYPLSFYTQYKQTKNTIPQHRFWSPVTGAENMVSAVISYNGSPATNTVNSNPQDAASSIWSVTGLISKDNSMLLCGATSTSINAADNSSSVSTSSLGYEGIIEYHYTLDSTLGGPIQT